MASSLGLFVGYLVIAHLSTAFLDLARLIKDFPPMPTAISSLNLCSAQQIIKQVF